MNPSRARPLPVSLLGGLLLLSSLPPAEAQRAQDRLLAEIRQIQSQLATLGESQATLARAVEALMEDREQQTTADRRSRAETRDALERMERNVSTLSEAFREANDRLSALMAEVESVREAQRQAALSRIAPASDEAASGGGEEEEPGEDPGEPPEAAGAAVLDAPSVSEIYLEAQADYYQGRYDLAVDGFERVAALGGELADNARYLIGESLLAQDRLEAALAQFEIVIDDFPDSGKLGEAWYKKGVILARLGHESDAREIFEEILDVFAGTPAARLAQRQLDSMPREPGS